MLQFTNEDELMKLLLSFPNIDLKTWIKPVSALYKELTMGECILEMKDGKLHRRVDVVCVKCYYTDNKGQRYQLVETKQVFKNGHVKQRGYQYVAEKVQLGEQPKEAALRGLAEELQIYDVDVIELPQDNCFETSNTGFESSYNKYGFSCNIPDSYYKDCYVEDQPDKSTFFSWIPI